ncbi:MAG: DUF362 domain-containing protein [Candidatus Bathyarchaeota archaeon]|nr:DUF362 domain-containing protein [Candidatus Bathyarchaeota archaeon]
MSKVSIVKVEDDINAAVRHSVGLVGGMNLKPSQHVVIKPNICNSKNPNGMVITDFRVIEAVVEIVKEKGNEMTIVESDNISGTADKRAKKSGLLDLLDVLDVPFLNLSHDDYEEHEVAGTTLRMPRTVMDADYFINLPKMKTCAHTLVTLALKNLYGVFQRKKKSKLHKHLDEVIPFLAEKVRNDFIVLDGINCMEGNGPIIGTHLCLNLILAGTNPVSVDSIASRLMGFDPAEVSHLALSNERGVGELDLDKIEVSGEDWKRHVQEFERPFSLKATLKSARTIKDIYLSG